MEQIKQSISWVFYISTKKWSSRSPSGFYFAIFGTLLNMKTENGLCVVQALQQIYYIYEKKHKMKANTNQNTIHDICIYISIDLSPPNVLSPLLMEVLTFPSYSCSCSQENTCKP